MTQFKRKKRRFETPIWVLQVSLVGCLALWLLVMFAPFSAHDAAVERNGLRKDSLLQKEKQAHQAEEASVHLAAVKKAFSLDHGEELKARLAEARNKAEEAAEKDGKGDDALEGDDDAMQENNSKDQDGDDDGGNLEDEGQGDDAEGDDAEGENSEEEEDDEDEDEDGGTDDGGDDENEEEEGTDDGAAEEIQRRRRLSEPDGNDTSNNDGKEELESKRFVFELENLTDGDSHGRIVIETRPGWASIGAAHFHDLVQNGFYDQSRFFRVVPNFVVQFGINAEPSIQRGWENDVLDDDPPNVETNRRGTLVYATAGPNTRTTQLFINTKDNGFLDSQGFTPFAEVVKGMEHVDRIDKEYGEKPEQGLIQTRGNDYLNDKFPNLSYVVTVYEDTPEEGGN